MKTRILAAAIAMGSAGLAQAQQIQATISYQLSFTDVLAGTTTPGNGNGIIEPWEGAHIRLTALMTPPVGSNVPTTLTPSGTAQLRGIMSIFLDLQGTIDAHGVWSHLRIDPNWDLLAGQGNGTPVVGGTQLQNIQAGQFPYGVGVINQTNPLIDVWQGVWTPLSYTPRMVVFETINGDANPTPFAGSALVRLSPGGHGLFLPGTVANGFTSITMPIVPAPATLVAFASLVLCFRRRRARMTTNVAPFARVGALPAARQ